MPPKHVVEFDFALRQVVKMEGSGITGSIRGLYVNSGGVKQYLVHYTSANGAVCEDWCEAADLVAA